MGRNRDGPVVRNRDDLVGETTSARDAVSDLALDCVEAGIRAANPREVAREAVGVEEETLTVADEAYDLDAYEEIVVLGGGKAAVGIAAALEDALGERIDRGVVVSDDVGRLDPDRVEIYEGDHPVPSERGVEGARRVLDRADAADKETLVLAIVTGGGSALLPAPAEGLSLADLRATTEALLASGGTIGEMNAVRKHCSAIKGGRLAERAAPATVVGLAVSDVVGDDLATVASGPLSPDDSTFGDAIAVLDRYGIDAPRAVRERLTDGSNGAIAETPTAGDPAFDGVSVHVVASATTALDAAAETARESGYDPLVLSSRIRGEAREAAKTHAAVAEEILTTGNPVETPAVVLSGGETTVTVRGDGEGGPNLEFALAWALDLDPDLGGDSDHDPDDRPPVALASVDTDGRDGGTEVAGALVDDRTVREIVQSANSEADCGAGDAADSAAS
uniref:glycerate kinase type-2 family protein n=1 Tax=Halorussus litoreus TaxID=1710536 RepID=UPI000E2544BC